MMTIIDYFDHTAIINLPERADRRAETREEFKRVGWQIENKKVDFLRQKTHQKCTKCSLYVR